MRQPYKKQITIGSKNIKEIEFDLNCRHEIIPILMGLQRIYKKRRLLGEILDLIKQDVLGGKSEKYGTQGLCYWELLVLSAVRHGCNLDYDALQDLANNHKKLREMMGFGDMDKKQYSRSAIYRRIERRINIHQIDRI